MFSVRGAARSLAGHTDYLVSGAVMRSLVQTLATAVVSMFQFTYYLVPGLSALNCCTSGARR